ncbi:DegV family protein [Actinopolymorpha cephalotaxi]|uniref:DegV family protein with EDD domain n=1 Tax=Actinopolymorpha cephalotaxi TaxID=504797 RepID=A0ABX2S2W5_9ACTN|nr:DegV family protein [Actinopolymorpha cephalotaxi]NYH83928.1 DegV family protein with EDD domain [Actinopolymorpha cephalotaxi]
MAGHVALVTDSTAHLDGREVDDYGISVVPTQVTVGSTTYTDGDPEVTRLVTDSLRRGEHVRTSRPSPMEFLAGYTAAARTGCSAAVSIHLSGDLSGTHDAARLGAVQAPLPVAVVDSRQVGMGLGFAVLAAADAARRGADAAEVVELARARAAAAETFLYVDSLDYLRRGGRIRLAQAVVGSALPSRPILQVRDGRVTPCAKVRTGARAMAELERLALNSAGIRSVEVAVHHLGAPILAGELAARLGRRVRRLVRIVVREAASGIGAHVGPGMVSVVVSPTDVD